MSTQAHQRREAAERLANKERMARRHRGRVSGQDNDNSGLAVTPGVVERLQDHLNTAARPIDTSPQPSGRDDGKKAKLGPAKKGNFIVIEIDPNRAKPDERQVRGSINQAKLGELAESIRTEGQNEPGQVFAIEGDPRYDWQVVKGHRRRLACIEVGCLFKVIVQAEPGSLEASLTEQLLSNKFREDLVPIDEAILAGQFLKIGLGHKRIGQKLGLKEPMVAKRLALLNLLPAIQAMMAAEVPEEERLGAGVAYEVSRLPQYKQMALIKLAETQGLTVNQVHTYVQDALEPQGVAHRYTRPCRAAAKPDQTGADVEELPRPRAKVPSDIRAVFVDRLRRIATILAVYSELDQIRFDLMFAPRTAADLESVLYNAQRVINTMGVVIEKLKKARPKPRPKPREDSQEGA